MNLRTRKFVPQLVNVGIPEVEVLPASNVFVTRKVEVCSKKLEVVTGK